MANKISNFPVNQLNNLAKGTTSEIIQSLTEIGRHGKPKTTQELRDRIDQYFLFCQQRDFRIGTESLCLSLGISRQAFWQWCNGSKGEEWQVICQQARQVVACYLEQIALRGKVNPVVSIFFFKNWFNYRDHFSMDSDGTNASEQTALSAETLPQLNENDTQLH